MYIFTFDINASVLRIEKALMFMAALHDIVQFTIGVN